ncbi:HDOD domain-containing protein [Massilia dura]|uniref:HDOD domain-containing protein n=1 Tax=Pseudoduganella dura TaxID=321982 RepID=A0A6I3XN64_9BURK|nr:HDOD domain-containing protein [Pseudoduganella dura]MUI15151.1 HDOD domain-containing protein [Pseudoduganella dura]GGY16553.1 hypothetical protein GCM10007386_52950 [Pseudoduganella dura]
MNTIFLQLLADRTGVPAGLVLAARNDKPASPAQALARLAAEFPCHFRTGLAEAAAAPLRQAGWHELAAERTLRADAPPGKTLPFQVAWIEGDWALAPPARPAGNGAASRALALQLVERVNADADTHEIEALLRRDPTLSYHLLRLVNSLGAGVRKGTGRTITNFSQAILLLGRQQLRRWLNLMLFAARGGDGRSAMLLARVSVRARLMELLARATGLDRLNQEQAFMTGMFSLLGALFGAPLADVLAPLALSAAVQRALLSRQGDIGALLALVEAAEQADFDAVSTALEGARIPAADFNAMVIDANLWMLAVTGDMAGRCHA